MAISSVVAVADRSTIEGDSVDLAFVPGDTFPVSHNVALSVQGQPFPNQPPTRVVPAITSLMLGYGRLTDNQQPPSVIPEDHYLRMLSFDVGYVHSSWQASGSTATLQVGVTVALRDNTPGGDDPPDDPFVAILSVQAICIWTSTTGGLIGRLDHFLGGVLLGN
jgi:hypothetical protein